MHIMDAGPPAGAVSARLLGAAAIVLPLSPPLMETATVVPIATAATAAAAASQVVPLPRKREVLGVVSVVSMLMICSSCWRARGLVGDSTGTRADIGSRSES